MHAWCREVSLYFLVLRADSIDLCRPHRSPEFNARDFAPLLSSNVRGPVTNGRFGARGLTYMISTSFRMYGPIFPISEKSKCCLSANLWYFLGVRHIRKPPKAWYSKCAWAETRFFFIALLFSRPFFVYILAFSQCLCVASFFWRIVIDRNILCSGSTSFASRSFLTFFVLRPFVPSSHEIL